MCGIAGWIRNTEVDLSRPDLDRLRGATKDLFCEIETRGRSSSGIATINGEHVNLVRRCYEASKFTKENVYSKVEKTITPHTRTVLLHTRAPTHGDVTQVNAHPMHKANIIGVHNGVIHNHDELEGMLKEKVSNIKTYLQGETDSERLWAWLAYSLQGVDPDERLGVIGEALKEGAGSAALAMAFDDDKSVFFWKKSNPTYFFYDPLTRTLFFASEFRNRTALEENGFDRAANSGCHTGTEYLYRIHPSHFTDKTVEVYDYIKSEFQSYWKNRSTNSQWWDQYSGVDDTCCNCTEELEKTYHRTTNYPYKKWCDTCYELSENGLKAMNIHTVKVRTK